MSTNYINTNNLTNKMELIKVSSRGQIVIPEDVRKKYDINQGDKLVLLDKNGVLLLKKASDTERALRKEWLLAVEQSFAEVWDNEEDDKVWDNA